MYFYFFIEINVIKRGFCNLKMCIRDRVYGVLPRVMSAARRLNDGMGDYVANQVIKLMNKKGVMAVSYTHLDVYKRQVCR